MQIEQDNSKSKKICISISAKNFELLEEERRAQGIPISTNLNKKLNEYVNNKEMIRYLQQEINQKTQVIENNLKMIEQINKEYNEATTKINENNKEIEAYKKHKYRPYIKRVLYTIFALD